MVSSKKEKRDHPLHAIVIHRQKIDSERAFTYTKHVGNLTINQTKYMSQTQYLKMLEREIHKINRKIDLKILAGESYSKEARDHRLLLKKVHYHTRRSFFQRFFPALISNGKFA